MNTLPHFLTILLQFQSPSPKIPLLQDVHTQPIEFKVENNLSKTLENELRIEQAIQSGS